MLKNSFFYEEFFSITFFWACRYSPHDPLRLLDLSTWGQIQIVARRGLIKRWLSTKQGGDSEKIADTCLTRKRSSGWYWDNNSDAVATTDEVWEV